MRSGYWALTPSTIASFLPSPFGLKARVFASRRIAFFSVSTAIAISGLAVLLPAPSTDSAP